MSLRSGKPCGGNLKELGRRCSKESDPGPGQEGWGVSEKYRIHAMSFGHAGDGIVHVLLFKGDLPDEKWERQSDHAQRTLYGETIDLGGKITAEHGIGILRKSYLSMNLGSSELDAIKRLKSALDPKYILNPGKIFDL